MDAERLGEESKVLAAHPDWLAAGYDGQRNLGGLLDLTNPEAAGWMEEQIARVIEENGLEFFRLDHNTHPGAGLQTRREGYVENGYFRYYEALYAIYDRLRARSRTSSLRTARAEEAGRTSAWCGASVIRG
jgi:alpha-galactosidase